MINRAHEMFFLCSGDSVEGWSCAPDNPDYFYCPSEGSSMCVGVHIFRNQLDALRQGVRNTNLTIESAQARLVTLKALIKEKESK